jgi:hypothetical protein
LNKASDSYGHYLINTDRHFFVKYSTSEAGPWSFTFQREELETIGAKVVQYPRTYICLVCGKKTFCCLEAAEWLTVLDPGSASAQWIKVTIPGARGRCHVSGSRGALKRKIPHSSFPAKVFKDADVARTEGSVLSAIWPGAAT